VILGLLLFQSILLILVFDDPRRDRSTEIQMMASPKNPSGQSPEADDDQKNETAALPSKKRPKQQVDEEGGPVGPEPTRYGDWERNGIAKDF
jgi:hypothetical protein